MPKNRLVVCFDGTWNTPDKGANPTNVVKMVRAIRNRDDNDISQVVFYDKGVGTSGGTDKFTGGGLGIGLTANVVDGYRFLANNYGADDEIFIFGFSRGAYTARSLSGLISLAGLLDPKDLGSSLQSVIDIYQDEDLEWDEKQERVGRVQYFAPRRSATIKCVGVWDTVGSLGIPGDLGRRFLGGKYYFHNVELCPEVEVALHAVAIDEKRSAFAPTLWVSTDGKPLSDSQKVEQVWFAGAHSNVGGSYEDADLSDIAFDWMARRVSKLTSLALNDIPSPPVPGNAAGKSIDSRSLLYKDSVLYPYQRIINGETPKSGGFGGWFRETFSKFDRRNTPPEGQQTVNEAIHVSVLERWHLDAVQHDCKEGSSCDPAPYRPVNLAAIIEAHRAGRSIPVIGWDGLPMNEADAPWPA